MLHITSQTGPSKRFHRTISSFGFISVHVPLAPPACHIEEKSCFHILPEPTARHSEPPHLSWVSFHHFSSQHLLSYIELLFSLHSFCM